MIRLRYIKVQLFDRNASPRRKMMRLTSTTGAAVGALVLALAASAVAETGNSESKRWGFDTDKPDAPPTGFSFGRTGEGAEGKWVVKAVPDAPSAGNVLAQLDTDNTDYRFPVAAADAPLFKDVRLSVKCKPVAGKVDQACGLVFRYRDPDNYYLTRANALENNVRLYHVVKGRRVQFAGWNGKVSSGSWHALSV